MEWLTWCNDQLQAERWLDLSKDESDAHDLIARAYDDYADHHHPLYQPQIQHARNVGEHRIPGTRHTVDGYDPQTHTAYEFYGWYWHGCRTCHPQCTEMHDWLLDRTMDDVRQLVDDKRALLQARGYNLVVMWECEGRARKETDTEVAAFATRLALQDHLDPRDAFYGGRTNPIKLYHHVHYDTEEIWYDDFISTTDLSLYFGLAKCTVLPPDDLYHPVLPYRHQAKLTFPLCCTCVKDLLDQSVTR